ncbi:MAG: hypothetical protein ABH865_03630 [Candidatus Omnitrophota bacterium]|nr:hypothetical protein [Candidatus Omnitrophota bacterium]
MRYQKSTPNRKVLGFIIFLIACAGLVIFHERVIITLAKKNIAEVFPGSSIAIDRCHFEPTHLLAFQGITIKKEKIYDITLKELRIDYTLVSLVRRAIEKVSVSGLTVRITTPRASARALSRHIALKPSGALSVRKLAVTDGRLDLRTQEVRLEAGISLGADISRLRLEHFTFTLDSLTSGDVHAENASCSGAYNEAGKIFIPQVRFNKIKLADVSATLRFTESVIAFEHASARFLGGMITGAATVKVPEFSYVIDLHGTGLDAQVFTKDFELEDKFKMVGHWEGSLKAVGRAAAVTFFDSNFGAVTPGGNLEIIDKKFVEDMAQRTKTPSDILLERFRDYHYNKGVVDLSLEGNDMVAGVILDGEKGKSNFKIYLHDFLKTLLNQIQGGGIA